MGGDTSRHSSYSRTLIPRQKRSLPVYGEKEDSNKYFRCWNCGFVCNIDRDSLDTGELGGSGVVLKDYALPSQGSILSGDPLSGLCVMDDFFTVVDPNATYYRHHYPDVVGGCPFCGTKNWK